MKRLLFFALILGLCLFVVPEDAYAHGGQYRVPGGGVDPGLREPTDPTPPPPPPPSGPPTTPPSGPPPSGPTAPPSTPPAGAPPTTPPSTPTPGLGGGERGKKAGLSYDNWVFWYAYNNAEIENLKESIYAAADTDSPLAQMGGGVGNQGSETQDIKTKIESHVIPLFLWAMDPNNAKHDDVESAAYIGLAKVARDPQHIELIKMGLNKKNSKIVKESAALALGLLRRTATETQFSPLDLDKIRDTLFDLYRNEKRQTRERCFAAFGLGLLGDQPSGDGSASGEAEVTRKLFALITEDFGNVELTVAALSAIGMQRERSITEPQRQILRDCVTKSRIGKRNVSQTVPAYAAATLGKIGNSNDVNVLRRALTSRRSDRWLQNSASIGLGQLADLLTSEQRVELTKGLLGSLKKIKVQQAVNFAMISLAYIVSADVEAERTDVLSDTKVGDYLLKTATDGKPLEKPYAALALGLICRKIGESPDADVEGEFRHRALKVLRDGIATKKLAPRDQSAFCIAVGMARDGRSIGTLREIVADRKSNREKAGYAALSLGLIPARGNADVLEAITSTLKRTNDEELKIRCATALGLLRDNRAVDMLLEELDAAKQQTLKGQIGLAIAKIGDGRAVEPIVRRIRDMKEKYLTRAILTASLGVIGDLEYIPSLNKISKDINYRALNDSLQEVLSIL